jgi:hypothetical protein
MGKCKYITGMHACFHLAVVSAVRVLVELVSDMEYH